MKYLLTSSLIFLLLNCEGQTTGSGLMRKIDTSDLPTQIKIDTSEVYFHSPDTSKVWFLAGWDFAKRPTGIWKDAYDSATKTHRTVADSVYSFSSQIFQFPGYIVNGTIYLGDKKKPLDSTLIIWDSKPRK